jgi:hypothetical protein
MVWFAWAWGFIVGPILKFWPWQRCWGGVWFGGVPGLFLAVPRACAGSTLCVVRFAPLLWRLCPALAVEFGSLAKKSAEASLFSANGNALPVLAQAQQTFEKSSENLFDCC